MRWWLLNVNADSNWNLIWNFYNSQSLVSVIINMVNLVKHEELRDEVIFLFIADIFVVLYACWDENTHIFFWLIDVFQLWICKNLKCFYDVFFCLIHVLLYFSMCYLWWETIKTFDWYNYSRRNFLLGYGIFGLNFD